MNYFDLLNTYHDNTSIKQQIDVFETTYGIFLPRLYKSLISIYDLSYIGTERILSFYDTSHDAKLQFYEVKNKLDDNISIEQWFVLDEIIEKMRLIYPEDQFIKDKYIAIGESFDQGILLLGIAEDNLDEIFLERAYSEPRIKKINHNIFDFLYEFEISPMESYLPSGIKLSNLYKSWGEDFWRIKE